MIKEANVGLPRGGGVLAFTHASKGNDRHSQSSVGNRATRGEVTTAATTAATTTAVAGGYK